MTTLTTYPALEQTAGTIGESPATPVYAIVGFDGSAARDPGSRRGGPAAARPGQAAWKSSSSPM